MGNFGRQQQSRPSFARPLFAACFLLFSVRDVSAGEETCTYENSRYEFAVDASCDYFGRFDVIIEADNGDGILLRSEAEGLEVRIFGTMVLENNQTIEKVHRAFSVHPRFEIVGTQSRSAPPDRFVSAMIEPLGRKNITITVLVKAESTELDDLWIEVELALSLLRPSWDG